MSTPACLHQAFVDLAPDTQGIRPAVALRALPAFIITTETSLKTPTLISALALALAGASAHAAVLPLQHATITATYNGSADGMLGLDHEFATEPGSNISKLDPTDVGVEFFTSDFLFGIDFAANGMLTVLANSALPAGATTMRFDFGNSLANPISAFTLVGASGASGAPGLSIVDAHTIALDLAGVEWAEYGSFTAQIGTDVALPEPAGIACARRSRKPRKQRG